MLLASAAAAQRPDSAGSRALYRFDDREVVERHDSPGGDFRIHYTLSGRNAVPGAPGVQAPAFVELVAARYDDVLRFYRDELGFREPLSDAGTPGGDGGDGRFDVYLLDFEGRGDGVFVRERCEPSARSRCSGYMAQENDFLGYRYPSYDVAVRTLASHEFFHAIQAAYDADQGSVFAEATAVWGTERYDPDLDDLEGFVRGYLDSPDRPLDEPLPGPVDPFSYGAAIFFQFLDERFGPELIVALWESVEDGARGVPDPRWVSTLAELLPELYEVTFAEALAEFASWNLFTGNYANSDLAYARGEGYPAVKVQTVTLPFQDSRLRRFRASTAYFRAEVAGRAQVTAAIYGEDGQRADLELFIAGRDAARQSWPELVPPGRLVDTDGWETATLMIVNAAIEGDSRRPGVCFGDRAEVDACLLAAGAEPLPAEPDAVDAGPGEDAGGAADAGPVDATADADGERGDAASEAGGGSGGGCLAAGRPGQTPHGALWALWPALLLMRRRSGCRTR